MSLHQILLEPTDVLFFRDGRPMSGSLAGHTAAWPLPDITNHALHAALHRAGLEGAHPHREKQADGSLEQRDRRFGSLLTAGPFPVVIDGPGGQAAHWYFPCPRDLQNSGGIEITLSPARSSDGSTTWSGSNLPAPLRYPVASCRPPSKEAGGELWISSGAFADYLRGGSKPESGLGAACFLRDGDFADLEQTIGIGIDADTGTTGRGDAQGKIYSAHYLRLREQARLGMFAEAMDKTNGGSGGKRDLIASLFTDQPRSIVVGGQQRICTAHRSDAPQWLPLPRGLAKDFKAVGDGSERRWLVKWVLISPAVWPGIHGDAEGIVPHPGGWLPNWICPSSGAVLLKTGDTSRRDRESRESWRGRVRAMAPLTARLVAALVPKPLTVTGWALPNESARPKGGAKSAHLAVPAGAVYYFEASSADAAVRLAEALNWHGSSTGPGEIRNRRSTLLGEKGYGLGVCGTWAPWPDTTGRPTA